RIQAKLRPPAQLYEFHRLCQRRACFFSQEAVDRLWPNTGLVCQASRGVFVLQPSIDDRLLGVTIDIERSSDRRETPERVVLAHGQPELRPRSKETIGLVHATS